MGTHPIFESDFDCLTERTEKNENAGPCDNVGLFLGVHIAKFRRDSFNVWYQAHAAQNSSRGGGLATALEFCQYANQSGPFYCFGFMVPRSTDPKHRALL